MPTFVSGAGRGAERTAGLWFFAAGVLVGLVTSPVTALYTLALGIPMTLLAWALSRSSRQPTARSVAAGAAGLVVGAAAYIAVAVVVGVVDGTPPMGSGSG